MNWGGSGIERVVFNWIVQNVEPFETVIELGAGMVSTRSLSGLYHLISVEHDPKFLDMFLNPIYVYAPIKDGWYDLPQEFKDRKKDEKLILIDGYNRAGILDNLHHFNPNAIYLIHDTYRDAEIKLALELSERLDRPVTFHDKGDHWATI